MLITRGQQPIIILSGEGRSAGQTAELFMSHSDFKEGVSIPPIPLIQIHKLGFRVVAAVFLVGASVNRVWIAVDGFASPNLN